MVCEEDYVYKKTENRRGDGRLLFSAAVAVMICVAVFVFASLGGTGVKIILSAEEIHAVCFGEFESEASALRNAAVLRQRGGAGYVYLDKKYFVLAVGFRESKDAQSVAAKSAASNETAGVIKLASPKAVINFEGTAKQGAAVKRMLDLFPLTFDGISELSLSLDRGLLTQNDVFAGINVFVQNAENALAELKDLADFSTVRTAAGGLAALIGILLDLKTSRQDSADLKRCAFCIFFAYKSFKEHASGLAH